MPQYCILENTSLHIGHIQLSLSVNQPLTVGSIEVSSMCKGLLKVSIALLRARLQKIPCTVTFTPLIGNSKTSNFSYTHSDHLPFPKKKNKKTFTVTYKSSKFIFFCSIISSRLPFFSLLSQKPYLFADYCDFGVGIPDLVPLIQDQVFPLLAQQKILGHPHTSIGGQQNTAICHHHTHRQNN